MSRPWFRVDQTWDTHPKVRLVARQYGAAGVLAWFVLLARACQVDGEFKTWAHVEVALERPEFGLDAALASKIAHSFVDEGLIDEVPGTGFVVHDWAQYQPPMRMLTPNQRGSKRPANGVDRPASDHGGRDHVATAGVATYKTDRTNETNTTQWGQTGIEDGADAYYALTGRFPKENVLRWLKQLDADFTKERVVIALAEEAADKDRSTLLSRVEARLKASAHREAKARTQARADAERLEAERRQAEVDAVPLEERKENMRKLREMLTDSGVLTKKIKPNN